MLSEIFQRKSSRYRRDFNERLHNFGGISAKTIMRSQSCQRCNKRVQAFVKKDVFVAKNYKYATFVARIYKVWSFFVLRERLPTSATLLLTEPKRSEYL